MASRWRMHSLLAFVVLQAAVAAASLPPDANCDGEVKHDDISAVIVEVFGGVQPAVCNQADVNEDGTLGAADVTAILQPVVDQATRSIAVFVMGDGMGPAHVRAGAIDNGGRLAFEGFPVFVPGMDTSSLTTLDDGEPTDSAAGATAFATGQRVFNGEVSYADGMDLVTAGELAVGAGKSVGIVTNSYLFDASPAAFVAHASRRERLTELANDYLALAPDVLIGAAPPRSFPLDSFIARARVRGYTVVRNADELEAVDLRTVRRLLALFAVDFDIGLDPISRQLFPIYGTPRILRTPDAIDPPLSRLAEVAVTLLARNPFGFFLFVENENIDTMSHAGTSALEVSPTIGVLVAGEVVELAEATERVVAAVAAAGREDDALIIVTADHETGGFTFPDDDPSAGTFPAAPNHTTQQVPVYASGSGAERFASVVDNVDIFHALRPALR